MSYKCKVISNVKCPTYFPKYNVMFCSYHFIIVWHKVNISWSRNDKEMWHVVKLNVLVFQHTEKEEVVYFSLAADCRVSHMDFLMLD